jgi:acetylornithine deacetylase
MHASLARPTSSAIEILLRAVLQLSQQVFKNRPDLVYNIRDIHSSQAGFAVPARCEAWLDIHVPPRISLGEILTQIEEMVPPVSQDKSGVDLAFRAATVDAGYELPLRGPMVAALQAAFARNQLAWLPDAFRSHSDANQIWAAGTKPILLGPGRLDLAHSEEESIAFAQVCQAAALYLDIMHAAGVETAL